MKARRDAFSGLAAPAAALVLLAAVSYFSVQRANRDQENRLLSSRSTGTLGVKALYLWLEEHGVPVRRRTASWLGLDESVRAIALFRPPGHFGPDEEETARALEWVERGGLMVLLTDRSDVLSEELGVEFGGGGKGRVGKERPSFLTEGVNALTDEVYGSLEAAPGSAGAAHMTRGGDPVLASFSRGKGRVVVFSQPEIFSNGFIRKGDALVLARRLFVDLPGGAVVHFDEYHQGWRDWESKTLAALAFTRPYGLFFLQAALAGGLALFNRDGLRRRRLERGKADPGAMEFVRAVGVLWEKSGASGRALGKMAEFVRREAAEALGLRPDSDWAETARALEARRPGAGDAVRGLHGPLSHARAGSNVPLPVAIEASRKLEFIRRELKRHERGPV